MPMADMSFWSDVSMVTWRSVGKLGTRRSVMQHVSFQRCDPSTGANEIMSHMTWRLLGRDLDCMQLEGPTIWQCLVDLIDGLEEECDAQMTDEDADDNADDNA